MNTPTVHEGLEHFAIDVSEDLVPSREQKAAGNLALDFGGSLNPPLQIHEDLKEGNGGQAWPAGMLLAGHLLRHHKDDLEGKKMVELGAGGGLVGLALAIGLPYSSTTTIHITDLEPMLALMDHNVTSNKAALKCQVTSSIYAWGTDPPADIAIPPDVVLAADCVYFEPAFPLLLQTLNDLIGTQTVCWFCFKQRRRADMGFARDLRKQFKVVEIDPGDGEENWRRENLHLYRITAKQST